MAEPVAVHLVKGDDASLVSAATIRLVEALVGDDEMAAEWVVEDAEVGAVLDACRTPPFLTDIRVVVVREAGRFSGPAAAAIAEEIPQLTPGVILVLVAGGGAMAKALLDAVKKVGTVVDASSPGPGKGRAAWMRQQVADAPVRLTPAAVELLAAHLGEDVARLSSLLDVLSAAFGHGAKVDVDDIEPFLGEAGGVAPWDLTDAIDRGDAAASLDALSRLLGGGQRHPLVVLATLHRHVQAMLRLDGSGVQDEAGAAALLGMSPFPARKALNQVRRLGSDGIARAMALVAQADLDLRGASEWPGELVLEVLVARLARLGPRAAARARG